MAELWGRSASWWCSWAKTESGHQVWGWGCPGTPRWEIQIPLLLILFSQLLWRNSLHCYAPLKPLLTSDPKTLWSIKCRWSACLCWQSSWLMGMFLPLPIASISHLVCYTWAQFSLSVRSSVLPFLWRSSFLPCVQLHTCAHVCNGWGQTELRVHTCLKWWFVQDWFKPA